MWATNLEIEKANEQTRLKFDASTVLNGWLPLLFSVPKANLCLLVRCPLFYVFSFPPTTRCLFSAINLWNVFFFTVLSFDLLHHFIRHLFRFRVNFYPRFYYYNIEKKIIIWLWADLGWVQKKKKTHGNCILWWFWFLSFWWHRNLHGTMNDHWAKVHSKLNMLSSIEK